MKTIINIPAEQNITVDHCYAQAHLSKQYPTIPLSENNAALAMSATNQSDEKIYIYDLCHNAANHDMPMLCQLPSSSRFILVKNLALGYRLFGQYIPQWIDNHIFVVKEIPKKSKKKTVCVYENPIDTKSLKKSLADNFCHLQTKPFADALLLIQKESTSKAIQCKCLLDYSSCIPNTQSIIYVHQNESPLQVHSEVHPNCGKKIKQGFTLPVMSDENHKPIITTLYQVLTPKELIFQNETEKGNHSWCNNVKIIQPNNKNMQFLTEKDINNLIEQGKN